MERHLQGVSSCSMDVLFLIHTNVLGDDLGNDGIIYEMNDSFRYFISLRCTTIPRPKL